MSARFHARHVHSWHVHSWHVQSWSLSFAWLPRGFAGLRYSDLMGDGSGWIFVRAGIFVVVGRKSLAHLHHREHAAHFDRSELTGAGHHWQRVVGKRHLHLGHHPHAVRAHCHGARRRTFDHFRQNLLSSADQVHHIVAHGIHGVVRFVAVKCPVARSVGDEVDRAHGTYRYVGGSLGNLSGLGNPAAIGTAHREVVPV